MRAYTDLVDMLHQEASHEITQEDADKLIKDICLRSPELEFLVLYIEPLDPSLNYWILIPAPSSALKDLQEAETTNLDDGRYPVAYWVRESQSTT